MSEQEEAPMVIVLTQSESAWLQSLVMMMGEMNPEGPAEWESELQGKLLGAPFVSPATLEVIEAALEGRVFAASKEGDIISVVLTPSKRIPCGYKEGKGKCPVCDSKPDQQEGGE